MSQHHTHGYAQRERARAEDRIQELYGGIMTARAPHPAVFSDELMPHFQVIINAWNVDHHDIRRPLVLDPFAGTGRIHELKDCLTFGIELEPEWAEYHERTRVGDATRLPVEYADVFDIVLTSPTYGNRMADSHTPSPEDTSTRITYTHKLGRKLTEGSTADKQWGDVYRELHERAWWEVRRVLHGGGWFVLNVKDHIRDHEVVPVCEWHRDHIEGIGFTLVQSIEVPVKGMGFGANADKRVDHEMIYVFYLPLDKGLKR